MVINEEFMPKWQKEILNFKGIKSTFLVEGNINDIYPIINDNMSDKDVEFCSLNQAIVKLFDTGETKGCYDFLFCDPLFGFTDPLHMNNVSSIVNRCEKQIADELRLIKTMNGSDKREAHSGSKPIKTSEVVRVAMTQADNNCNETERKSIAVVINLASHYISSPEDLSVDDRTFFLNLLYASENAIRGKTYINTLILVVNKYNDVPAWFYLNNPNSRTILLPSPDRFIREAYVCKYFKALSDSTNSENVKLREKFVDLTDGMKLLELGELRRMQNQKGTEIEKITDLVSIYKYGFKENHWERIRGKIGRDIKDKIEERVKGQEQAVNKIVQVIKRAVLGLSGLQHSSDGSKPRGIFFLAGPTGTGKTEMVKTITEYLFTDEKKLIRFDMSEYTAEHSDQKLFGAPPGYVGYDNGGQLTNAVKNNPFSVLLFDEIEKAHPNIMDKFLQILEDGRMTDGQGNTVYFSETLIFFTSNVGISREVFDANTGRVIGRESIVKPGEPYQDIQRKVETAMEIHFKPEVINRIGENIIVFNYIDEVTTKKIISSKLDKINDYIRRNIGITMIVSDVAMEKLNDFSLTDKVRMTGGRGIGNVIECHYINPLAEFIFDYNLQRNDSIYVDFDGERLKFTKR